MYGYQLKKTEHTINVVWCTQLSPTLFYWSFDIRKNNKILVHILEVKRSSSILITNRNTTEKNRRGLYNKKKVIILQLYQLVKEMNHVIESIFLKYSENLASKI